MSENFGLREKATKKVIATYENPVLARYANKDPERYEIIEKQKQTIYTQGPDGKTYAVGMKSKWIPYQP